MVGTKQGTLLHYKTLLVNGKQLQLKGESVNRIIIIRLNLKFCFPTDTKFDVRLLRSNKSFAKRTISQVVGIPELNLVISLSDGLISVHNLENIQDPCKLAIEKAKGALMFITDLQKLKTITDDFQYALMICAVTKRKVMFFYWKKDEFHHMESSDLVLNDIPRAVGWSKEAVYVGFKTEYARAKLGGKLKELFPVGSKHVEPFVECLSDNRFALAKDEKIYLFGEDGEPILKYPVNFSSNLLKIVDDLIYLVALLPNSTVEIKTIEPKLDIQTIQLQSRSGKFKQLIKCANKSGQIYTCSTSDVFALVVVDYKKQISQLIEKGHFETALSLAIIYKDNQKAEDNKQIDYIKYLQAFDYFCKMQFNEAITIYAELKIDPSVVIGLYPDLLPEEFRSKLEYPAPVPELKGDHLDNAIAELSNYLIEVRHQLQKPESEIQYASIKGFSQSNKESASEVLYNNIDKLKQIVDTTLLKCYLKTNDALVASLLRLPHNHCHLEEAEKVLKYYNKYNELIILYQCRSLHRRALELLQKMNSQSKASDGKIRLANLHLRTKEYLQHLGRDHLELIFEFAEWVLREYPDDGLKIFIEDMPEIESLPRKQVLDYLRSINGDFVIPYLEHIIYEWKDIDHNLHDTLVNEYREKIRVLLEEYKLSLGDQKPAKAGKEPGELGVLRQKLMEFLQKSDYYTAEKLAFFFLNDNLWEERAIVLSKIGQHQEALTIYVYILKDTDKAEEYCETVFNKDLPGNRDVFFQLLRLYLSHQPLDGSQGDFVDSASSPPVGEETPKQNREIALRLLQNYATKMDPISVLNELPDDLPVNSIAGFLDTTIKNLIHRKHEVQVHRNLLLSQHLAVQKQKINLHRNKVVIDEYSLCHCCNKRIGKR